MESTNDTINTSTMDKKQLLEAVRNQVEYYFSKENLQSDIYLTSQMDAQMTVPLSVVMKFAKLKALTQDETIVREALADSAITSIVDNRIKASVKPAGRSTIILREIPSDAPTEEVKEIFNFEGCKPIGTIRSDIGDTWFVSMDTEEDAKDTLLDLRLKKRSFRGQAIKARIKTETVIRSFYPLPGAPVIPTGYPAYPVVQMPMDMRSFGYSLPQNEPVIVQDTVLASTETKTDDNKNANNNKSNNNGKDNRGADNRGKGGVQSNNKSTTTSNNNSNNNNNNKKSDNSRNSKGSNSGHRKEHESSRPHIEINSANFPPLSSEDTPVPTPGYKDSYIKYSFEEVLVIVKEVKDASLPSSLDPTKHPYAMTASANMDLLKKQRTYSIDETREQLRQGRPVHREAITAGAVDIRSFIYGDEGQQTSVSNTVTAPHAVEAATAAPALHSTPSKSVTKSRSGSHDLHNQTPKKISASTWAAMVKSSAAATEGTPAPVSAVKAPATAEKVVAKTPASASKEVKAGDKTGDKKKSAPKSDAKEGNKPADKEGGSGNRRDRKKKEASATASDDHKDGDVPAGEITAIVGEDATGEASAAGGAWGGKASFANIVKLKSAEDGEVSPVASPVKQEKPASAPSSNNGGNKSNSGNKSGSRPSTGPKSGSGNKEEGGQGRRNRNNHNSTPDRSSNRKSTSFSSNSGANASGVWVKETLPALKK